MTTLDARLRELLAVKLDDANFHHSAARLRGEKNTGHLMTAEMMEAAVAFGMDAYKLGLSDAAEIAEAHAENMDRTDFGAGYEMGAKDVTNAIRAKGEQT